MFTKASVADEQRTLRVFYIRLDEFTASTNILQHESKDLGLFGLQLDAFQCVFVAREI